MSTPLLLVFKKQPNYLIAWVNHDGDSRCRTFKETKIEELERLFNQLWEYRNNSKVFVSSIIPNEGKHDDYGLKYDVCFGNLRRYDWEENTDFIGSFRYGDDLTKVSADKLLDVYYNITERKFFDDGSYYCIIDLDKERVGSSGDFNRVPKMVRCGRKSNFDGKGFGARDMKNNIDYYDMRKSSLNTDYEDADSFDESYNMNESYSDLIRSKIFDVGHKFGLDVYGTDDGGIVFEDENMITSDDEELLVSLEKFENSIIIKYNDEGNVVVYLKDNLDDIDESYLVEGGVDFDQADDLFPEIKDLAKELGYQCFREKGNNSVIVFCCDNIDETSNFMDLCAGLNKILDFGANDGWGYQTINSNPVSLKVNCGFIHMDDEDFKYQPHELNGLRKYWNESYEMNKPSKYEQKMIDAVEKELKARKRNKEISKSDYESILINGDYIQKCFDCANGDDDYTGDVLTDAIYIVDQIISEL